MLAGRRPARRAGLPVSAQLRSDVEEPHHSGGGTFLILPLTGEIPYRCLKGCHKYSWRPSKSPYEIYRVKTGVTLLFRLLTHHQLDLCGRVEAVRLFEKVEYWGFGNWVGMGINKSHALVGSQKGPSQSSCDAKTE